MPIDAKRKAAERRTPTLRRIMQAVTVETRPERPHASGMSEEDITIFEGTQRIHLRNGNFPLVIGSAWRRIEQHLKLAVADPLNMPLDRLRLPERTLWALDGIGVKTVGDTLLVTEERLLGLQLIGPVAVEELRATVAGYVREQSLALVLKEEKEQEADAKGVAN